MNVGQGEVWLAELSPTRGIEQRGVRPVVVISGERFSRMPIDQAIVVPVTSRDRGLPHHIYIHDDGGLTRDSWAMSECVHAISTQRLRHRISTTSNDTTTAIIHKVRLWLD